MGIGSSTESRAPNVLFTIAPNEVHIVTSFSGEGLGLWLPQGFPIAYFSIKCYTDVRRTLDEPTIQFLQKCCYRSTDHQLKGAKRATFMPTLKLYHVFLTLFVLCLIQFVTILLFMSV